MTALTKPQLDQLTDQLHANRQALRREVREELENSGEQHRIAILNAEPGDVGDLSLAAALADFNVARFDRHIRALRDIDAAFQRIKDGQYGICTDCGNEIGFARLQAYPTAKRCIICQEQHEKQYAQEGHPKM